MRFGAFTYAYSTNVGDEIQTLAATQFLPRVDMLIERDRLHWYRGGPPVFVIFNGWFTHQPFWPPPDSIRPLFISFHAALPEMLVDRKFLDYFRRHEPIGCRSLSTLEAFRAIGVRAYFSGCLTLTLRGTPQPRTDRVLAVDVEQDMYAGSVPSHIRKAAIHLSHEFPPPDANLLSRAKWRALYLAQRGVYKYDYGRRLLANACTSLNAARHCSRLSRARKLLALYSEARLVITSRLHCALPCLALGTPVLLLRRGVESDPRFAGLRDLVRYHSEPSRPVKIDWREPGPNPDAYVAYAEALRRTCEGWVRSVLGTDSQEPEVLSPLIVGAERQ